MPRRELDLRLFCTAMRSVPLLLLGMRPPVPGRLHGKAPPMAAMPKDYAPCPMPARPRQAHTQAPSADNLSRIRADATFVLVSCQKSDGAMA